MTNSGSRLWAFGSSKSLEISRGLRSRALRSLKLQPGSRRALDSCPPFLLNNWSVKLTDQLVRRSAAAGGARRGPAPAADPSRDRVFAAAATAFAAHGFAGDQRRPHRRRRAPQQGDDLLPLPQQGRALSRDPPRHVRGRRRARAGRRRLGASRRPTRSVSSSTPSPPKARRGRTSRRSGSGRSPKAGRISTTRRLAT